MPDLNCPKCGGRMTEVDEDGILFDTCSSCEGIWMDRFALNLLLERQLSTRWVGDADDFMVPSGSEATSLTCPRCTAALLSYTQSEITVEWCSTCRGIYLDRDELGRIDAWRRANRRERMKQLAKDATKDGAKAAAQIASSVLIGDLLSGIFGGPFGNTRG